MGMEDITDVVCVSTSMDHLGQWTHGDGGYQKHPVPGKGDRKRREGRGGEGKEREGTDELARVMTVIQHCKCT